MNEIFVFLAVASANLAEHGYPPGERHGLLIMVRQLAGTAADVALAIAVAEESGWTNVSISSSARILPENLDSQNDALHLAYKSAIADGTAIVVYADAVDDEG